MTKKALSIIVLLTAATGLTTASIAQPPHGGPPPEAIEACAGQSDGDLCAFVGRRGETIEGTCRAREELACVPRCHEPS